ncbi:hypothetical protein [Miltoncostaea marina]|uniref:hypothetical protein n=1 Tax=Miltoncostaea marina TaxID=2843215 RepID=UPI001C3C2C2A|nr:hypothetical protein [Miltoncostaea marina]
MPAVAHPAPAPVADALAAVARAHAGLLALTIPGCGACMLLPASLAELRRARPGLVVAIGEFASPEDWRERERLLWPRGIHVSRSSVPALALLVDGEVVASRPGGGPAALIDRWIASLLGPAERPIEDGPTAAEAAALDALAGRIAAQRHAKRARAGLGGEGHAP